MNLDRSPARVPALLRSACPAGLVFAALTFFTPIGGGPEACQAAGALVSPPREVVQLLREAQRAVQQRRHGDAVLAIDELLQADAEDAFLPPENDGGVCRTLRSEIDRLIASLPPAGWKQYEQWCGPQAGKQLAQAVDRRDAAALARVVMKHPGTRAAAEAAFIRGRIALDRAQPWEALSWWRLLKESPSPVRDHEPALTLHETTAWLMAGDADRARQRFDQFQDLANKTRFHIGGEPFDAGDDLDVAFAALKRSLRPRTAVSEPRQWPVFGGNAAGDFAGVFRGEIGPLLWRVETGNTATAQSSNALPLPAAQPLLAGGFVFARTPQRLIAIEMKSGQQRWEYPRETESENLYGSVVQERLLNDSAYGRISSDGQRLYLLDGLEPAAARATAFGAVIVINGRQIVGPREPKRHNRLIALSLESDGKICWSTGLDEPQLEKAAFLGSPLPHDGRLYVMAEMGGDICLCTIDAASGQLLWKLPIAAADPPVYADPRRRLAAASPTFRDGVLVCPTSAGTVVGVDPYTRRFLWAYEYPVRPSIWHRGRRVVRRSGKSTPWIDSTARLAANRVVLAPVESEDLLCLNARTGDLKWKASCDTGLFVAGICKNHVVVVGTNAVFAWDLITGKPAWEDENVPLPDSVHPAGRGFFSSGAYYLPVDSQEIIKIDVQAGRIASRLRADKPLGNAIACDGRLVSLSCGSILFFGDPATEDSPPKQPEKTELAPKDSNLD